MINVNRKVTDEMEKFKYFIMDLSYASIEAWGERQYVQREREITRKVSITIFGRCGDDNEHSKKE